MYTRIITVILASILLASPIQSLAATTNKDVTLKEKIGQMILVGFDGTSLKPDDAIVSAIKAQQIGGVILFDYNYQTGKYDKNIKSPAQLKALTTQLQTYAKEAANEKGTPYLPLLISIDYEGGKVNRLKAEYGFPETLSAAKIAKLSSKEALAHANKMAETLEEEGINLDFAPVVDLNINPDNPVIGKLERSFARDSETVSKYAALYGKAFKDHNILCAYKHFPGHGSSKGDTHAGFVDVTTTWQPSELEPYKTLLNHENGCDMVMVAHVVHYGLDSKGLPASLSKSMITDLLRNEMKFNGIVITDDMQMRAITNEYGLEEALRLTINAGADIIVFGNQLEGRFQDPAKLVEIIYNDVKNGKIKESRINEAYERIKKLKERIVKPETTSNMTP